MAGSAAETTLLVLLRSLPCTPPLQYDIFACQTMQHKTMMTLTGWSRPGKVHDLKSTFKAWPSQISRTYLSQEGWWEGRALAGVGDWHC